MLAFKNGDIENPKPWIQIYDGNELIRDFVVCRNPEGKIGVYDRVHDKFYELTNCVVVQEGDYTRIYTNIEYEATSNLSFDPDTGGQYIDTGVIPDILKGGTL